MKHLIEIAQDTAQWIIFALLGGIGWLVRRAVTDRNRIDMLVADLKAREKLREEDRQALKEVKEDVSMLTKHLLERD